MKTVRSFESSLQRCKRALELLQRPSFTQYRSFTATPRYGKNGALPAFPPTENSELNDLLATIRRTIFIPSHLCKPHRNLIYRTKHHAILESDPVTVDIAAGTPKEETIRLFPVDRTRDVPDSWVSVLKVMALMGDTQMDWEGNFLGVLEGMHTAGRRWKDEQVTRIVREASERGMVHLVVEALRRSEKTGMKLNQLIIVREVLWGCRTKAVQGKWDERSMGKALRYAEQIAEMLDNQKHWGRYVVGPADPRVQADVIGVLLELAAVRAVRHLEGHDEGGKVEKYAARLVVNLQNAAPVQQRKRRPPPGYEALEAEYEMLRWLPVWNGLKVAAKMLGNDMPKVKTGEGHVNVKGKIDEIEANISTWRAVVNAVDKDMGRSGRRKSVIWLEELE